MTKIQTRRSSTHTKSSPYFKEKKPTFVANDDDISS